MLAVILLVAGTLAIGFAVEAVLRPLSWIGLLVTALFASSLLAQRSLERHVRDVADALEHGGLAQGRKAVSMIVGRDPDRLDESAVCRAAIESLAENFSDGITAPAFWLAVGGLGGGLAYKAINTADSMIGHRTPRHEAFGWAAARLDDLGLATPTTAGMRVPVLRETRMPAVLCTLGPVRTVVDLAPAIAEATAAAVECWVRRLPST